MFVYNTEENTDGWWTFAHAGVAGLLGPVMERRGTVASGSCDLVDRVEHMVPDRRDLAIGDRKNNRVFGKENTSARRNGVSVWSAAL